MSPSARIYSSAHALLTLTLGALWSATADYDLAAHNYGQAVAAGLLALCSAAVGTALLIEVVRSELALRRGVVPMARLVRRRRR